MFKRMPNLWKKNSVGYCLLNQRNSTLSEMLEALQQSDQCTDICSTKEELSKLLLSLRKVASEEKNLKITYKSLYKPTHYFASELGFLEPYVSPFYCKVCKEYIVRSITYDTFKVHMSKHTGQLPFDCFLCDKRYAINSNLIIHLRRHVQDLPNECEVCGFKCATKMDLKRHSTTHTGEKRYCCPLCGERFRTASRFAVHKRRHDPDLQFACVHCEKRYITPAELRDHIKTHFNIKDTVCAVCGKGFTNKKLLRQHGRVHLKVERKPKEFA